MWVRVALGVASERNPESTRVSTALQFTAQMRALTKARSYLAPLVSCQLQNWTQGALKI